MNTQRHAALQADQDSGAVRLCFGSRKLFHAQHHLEANGYRSHDEWKAHWEAKRFLQFFVLGSADETAGCQGCQAPTMRTGWESRFTRAPHWSLRAVDWACSNDRPCGGGVSAPTRNGDYVTFLQPARNRKKHVWAYWSVVRKRLAAAHEAHTRSGACRAAPQPLSPARRLAERSTWALPVRFRQSNRQQHCSADVWSDVPF